MNKKIVSIIVGIVVVGGGAIWYFTLSNTDVTVNTALQRNTTVTDSQTNDTNSTSQTNTNSASIQPSGLPTMPEPVSQWTWLDEPFLTISSAPQSKDEALEDCAQSNAMAGDTNRCLILIATGFRHARACEWMVADAQQTGDPDVNDPNYDVLLCYIGYISHYGAYDCTVHADQPYRDYCYFVAASFDLQTLPLCKNIVDAELRQMCNIYEDPEYKSGQGVTNIQTNQGLLCYYRRHPNEISKLPDGVIADYFNLLIQYIDEQNVLRCTNYPSQYDTDLAVMMQNDTDADGLSDILESFLGTRLEYTDVDNDGFTDIQELSAGYDPNEANIKAKLPLPDRITQLKQDLVQLTQ